MKKVYLIAPSAKGRGVVHSVPLKSDQKPSAFLLSYRLLGTDPEKGLRPPNGRELFSTENLYGILRSKMVTYGEKKKEVFFHFVNLSPRAPSAHYLQSLNEKQTTTEVENRIPQKRFLLDLLRRSPFKSLRQSFKKGREKDSRNLKKKYDFCRSSFKVVFDCFWLHSCFLRIRVVFDLRNESHEG